jgi:glycosyltransferase involved in cell wall biosynthesis
MRVHLDFTDVVRHAYLNKTITGIQRVQLETARTIVAADPSAQVFSYFNGHYQDLTGMVRLSRNQAANELFFALRRLYGLPVFTGVPVRNLRERKTNALNFIKMLPRMPGRHSKPSALPFGPDDLIYIGGAFWADRHSIRLYEEASRNGATLVAFIHDVIPLTFPQFTNGGTRRFFDRLLRLPLHVITNSAFTKADLVRAQALVEGAQPFRSLSVVPLAQEFPGVARNQNAADAPSRRLAKLNRAGPFVLSVGTIEIRKNHLPLLSLWSKLTGDLGGRAPKLVVAGKRGWMARRALRALDRAGTGSPYILIEAPTDRELAWLYSKASFTIFTSLVEGWGLPVGESLWFGKPCIASNTTSIPEVGGDLCVYADPHRIESFAAPILRFIEDRSALETSIAKIRSSPLRTWPQVSADIASVIAECAGKG